ncbi:MAG: hypothetical protein QOE89_1313 [Pseudonocardiales bacterium]|jgi:hypothetical protein|nr:hypothetical protein [Pseudonocardiales bacterium]
MSSVCSQGHSSSTDDFCDVCGAPIEATAVLAAAAVGPAESAQPAGPPRPAVPKRCPNCQAANAADALFCERCGYEFNTGQLPPPAAYPDPVSGVLVPPVVAVQPGVPAAPELKGVAWVAEVWVDPDWFAHQQAEGSCPTSGLPAVVPLIGSKALIGRRSRSHQLNPEIDCANDGAISHRHAEVSLRAGRWSVKDLGSTNGTYVGKPDGRYPDDALVVQQPRELADNERVYLGAWTRIVIRRATDRERARAGG